METPFVPSAEEGPQHLPKMLGSIHSRDKICFFQRKKQILPLQIKSRTTTVQLSVPTLDRPPDSVRWRSCGEFRRTSTTHRRRREIPVT